MQELIASYLVQKKECSLPLLGNFRILTKPAEADMTNSQMFPPIDEIIFHEATGYLSDDFTGYIAGLMNITRIEAEEKFNHWCLHSKAALDSGEKITFDTIGSLEKDTVGAIFFERTKGVNFYDTIRAERATHTKDEHAVLVGDRETTSVAMNDFYREEVAIEKRSGWKIWAIVLFGVSLLVLVLYFYNHSFSETGVGNRSSFPVNEPPASYDTPK
ncbi:MAG: hypothetical protein ABI472_07050 [Ginsengibacter sp.]|mgnify:CR=1 FL=1